jgi:hypothetical protein
MTRDDRTHPVASATTTQVKLCPFDEEEPHMWFCLIEAQFTAAGIRSQKLIYANALAILPKQVLRDILDTVDVCNDSDDPFDCLKDALLGKFGKSKWQSYFELLRLPIEMQGLKPSIVSPDRSFSGHVFYSPAAFHARSGRGWQPQDSCSHGECCRRPVGCSGRPRPHSCGRHASAKKEPCS